MRRISTCRLFLSHLFILLIVAACRQSEDQEPIPEALVRSQIRSASEIPGLLNAIAPYVNPSLGDRGDISAANQENTYFGMSIDLEFIKSRIDSSSYTNYSMLLRDGVPNPRVIKNLVIGQNAEGQWKIPMLMTYTMSEEFYEQYRDTGSLEGFTGSISKEQLRPLSYQTQRSNREPADNEGDPDDYGSDRDRPDTTCPLETTITPGGGTTLVSDTYVEICEVFIVTVYSTDGHGNRYIHDQYLTYENCRVEEEYTNSDTENCEEPVGEIPINEDALKAFLCNRNIAFRQVGNARTAQITGLGLSLFRARPPGLRFIELGISCVTVPARSNQEANALFIAGYNAAVVEFRVKLNSGIYGSRPTTSVLKSAFKQTILSEIRALAGVGASVVRFGTGVCLGDIPITQAKYCKTN